MIGLTLALVLGAVDAPQWLGVSLGEPVAAVRTSLGDPVDEEDLGDGLTKSRYLVADNTAFLGVDWKNGVVVMLSLEPLPGESVAQADPSGAKIGDTEARIQTLRGKPDSTDNGDGADRWNYGSDPTWRYIFRNGTLGMIINSSLSAMPDAQHAPPVPPLHNGTSIANAIVIKGENAMTGVHWEYVYLAFHPCPGNAKRKMLMQALLVNGKRSFDALTTQCPNGNPQMFYFDITDFIGKL